MSTRVLGTGLLFFVLSTASHSATAEDSYKIEPLKEAPPEGVASAIKGDLNGQGYRVLKMGKPFAEVWLRKAIPASAKPAGAAGNVQFPILKEGELLGVLRFATEGQDYRDQAIPTGLYTMRYGLQPINGAHLGVSPFRDYALLLPAAKDTTTAPLAKKGLEEKSAEAAGTSHPAVLMLLTAPDSAKAGTSVVRDDAKDTWGAVVPLALAVKGGSAPAPLTVQLIISGAAAP